MGRYDRRRRSGPVAIAGLGSLDGAQQTLPELYQAYKSAPTDFHDITSGNSIGGPTYAPGPGYDLATGLGSPVGTLLIPRLVGIPIVTGVSSTQAPGAYGPAAPISITITFSEPVTVTGTPQLTLNAGGGAVATYTGGSGTSTLTFTYAVAAGQNSSDLDYASTAALRSMAVAFHRPPHFHGARRRPDRRAEGRPDHRARHAR